MTSPFGLMPSFVGLALAPFFEPIPPIRGDQGITADVGETGSLIEVPLPPRRPPELGGRLVAGASHIYDFERGFYGRRTGTPTATTTWRVKDTFTSGPSPWALTSGQEERLRKIAAQLSGCYGIDLQHAFTTMNIESKYAHDTMLGADNATYKGPFQYGQVAYRDAFQKPRKYVFPLADFRSIDKQCRAFAIDTIRFWEILKRKGITPEPWMLYMMHQQGWPTAPLIIKKSIDAPNTNLKAYVNRISRQIWPNILANPQFSATISASSTVLQLCNIFKGKYISNRDGTGGFQPVTDYIEQVNITVPIGAAGTMTAADNLFANFGLNHVVSGTGIDISLPYGSGNEPNIFYQGELLKALGRMNRITLLDFDWFFDDRGPTPSFADNVNVLGVSFGDGGALVIRQAEADPSQELLPKLQIWESGQGAEAGVNRYVPPTDSGPSEGLSAPYGRVRLVYRRTAELLAVAINGGDPATIESAMTTNVNDPQSATSNGKLIFRRVVQFPDNDNPLVLKYVSDPNFKIGTEPDLEPNLPAT